MKQRYYLRMEVTLIIEGTTKKWEGEVFPLSGIGQAFSESKERFRVGFRVLGFF